MVMLLALCLLVVVLLLRENVEPDLLRPIFVGESGTAVERVLRLDEAEEVGRSDWWDAW